MNDEKAEGWAERREQLWFELNCQDKVWDAALFVLFSTSVTARYYYELRNTQS